MKSPLLKTLLSLVVLGCSAQIARGSSFTYQGQLSDNGSPATGMYDLTFSLWDAAAGPAQLGSTITNMAVSVTNGLFSVDLDFGSSAFEGGSRWLEVQVRASGGGGDFTLLSPRQPITSTPYAITSEHVAGPVATDQLVGTLPPSIIGADTITSAMLAPETVTSSELDSSIGVWTQTGDDVYRSGGNVGIGATEPSALLHIHGSIAPARGQLSLSAPLGEDTFLSFYEGDNFKAYLWYDDSDDDLRLQNYNELDGGDLGLNPYGGNVGIGTLDPREKLEVEGGNIRIQGADGYDAPGESAYLYLGSTMNYIKSTRTFGLNLGTFGAPDALTLRHTTGNVGIGTTNPISKLDINGSVAINVPTNELSAVRFMKDGALNWTIFTAPWLQDDDLRIRNENGSGDVMVFDKGTGNVGIGTVSPTTKLDVAGTVKATAFSGVGSQLTGVVPALDTVTSAHIRAGEVKAEDIANNSINGGKIIDNSLHSIDIQNEPGVDWSYNSFQEVGLATEILASVTLDLPTSGFVVVLATADAQVHHGADLLNVLQYGISTPNASNEWEQPGSWALPFDLADGGYENSIVTQRVYQFNAAGPVTFNFLARMYGERIFRVSDATITAMFFPTKY